MTLSTAASTSPDAARRRELRKVAFATVIGTTIEWYDFFLYASAAGLVFGALFFAPAGTGAATLLSFATVGISFLFRPLGAFLAGHFGDKIGRKAMLVVTLLLMGGATTLIGVLPTYEQIGIAAPVLLVLLRILQGLSTGGEWGGAVLMAVEHAPADRRAHRPAARLGRARADDRRDLAGRRVPRLGLARAVPAELRAHRRGHRRAPDRRGEPGLHRAGREEA
jgi:MFS family permease